MLSPRTCRAVGFTMGALAFLVAHAIEVARFVPANHPGEPGPWFIATGDALVVTVTCVALTGILAGWLGISAVGLSVALGAIVAMTVLAFLFVHSNLFGIVILIGAGVLAMTILPATVVGSLFRTLLRPQR